MKSWLPRRNHEAHELGALLDDLTERIRDLEQADQSGARSVDEGGLEFYDDDDILRARIGLQPDGSFRMQAFGKVPQTPTEPDVIPFPGGCIVEWDGTYEDAQVGDIHRVAIHVGTTADFQIITGDEGESETYDDDLDDDSTERAAIMSPRGGSAFVALDPGVDAYWIRLTAVAEGGAESAPSPAVKVKMSAPEGAFKQDTFVMGEIVDPLILTYTPLDDSEHVYWNGIYQRQDVAWTRIGKTLTLVTADYAPKPGDVISVEYAYNPAEEPELVGIRAHQLDDYESGWLVGGYNGSQGLYTVSFHPSQAGIGDGSDSTWIQRTDELSVPPQWGSGTGTSPCMQFDLPAATVALTDTTTITLKMRVAYETTRAAAIKTESWGYLSIRDIDVYWGELEVYGDPPLWEWHGNSGFVEYSVTWTFADFAAALSETEDPPLTVERLAGWFADGRVHVGLVTQDTAIRYTAETDTVRVSEAWVEIGEG